MHDNSVRQIRSISRSRFRSVAALWLFLLLFVTSVATELSGLGRAHDFHSVSSSVATGKKKQRWKRKIWSRTKHRRSGKNKEVCWLEAKGVGERCGRQVESERKKHKKLNALISIVKSFSSTAKSCTAVAGGIGATANLAASAMTAVNINMDPLDCQEKAKGASVVDEDSSSFEAKISQNSECMLSYKPLPRRPSERGRGSTASFPPAHLADELADVESAHLLKASLGFISNSVGVIGDIVRVVGDTAGGFSGASIKLVGTGVRVVGSGLTTLSTAVLGGTSSGVDTDLTREGESCSGSKAHCDSSAAQGGRQQRSLFLSEPIYAKDSLDKGGNLDRLISGARLWSGQSIRAVSDVVKGVGDCIVLAGTAAETITSSIARVAEDGVRVVEHFAFAMSSSFENRPRRRGQASPSVDWSQGATEEINTEYHDPHQDRFPASTAEGKHLIFGTKKLSKGNDSAEDHGSKNREKSAKRRYFSEDIFEWMEEIAVNFSFKLNGYSCLAPEVFVVMICCYLCSISILEFSCRKDTLRKHLLRTKWWDGSFGASRIFSFIVRGKMVQNVQTTPDGRRDSSVLNLSAWEAEICDRKRHGQCRVTKQNLIGARETSKRGSSAFASGLLCSKLTSSMRLWYLPSCSRYMLLFFVHCLLCAYLCHVSQLRSDQIKRHAEASGFRAALASIGSSVEPMTESAAWLNNLLRSIWRVPFDTECEDKVTRSMPLADCTVERCDFVGSKGSICSDIHSSYGGLEPYISSMIGKHLKDILTSSRKSGANDVTYVSLHSLTLGGVPPVVRGIEFRGMEENGRIIKIGLYLDFILEDFSITLAVKLSSLEYSLMPSTLLDIGALDMSVALEIVLVTKPSVPYVSYVNVSFAEAPKCRLRITPLSHSSGLRGVDLGTLPLINSWVHNNVREALSRYVHPNYVSVNITSLISSKVCRNCESFGSASTLQNNGQSFERKRKMWPKNIQHRSFARKEKGTAEKQQLTAQVSSKTVLPSYESSDLTGYHYLQRHTKRLKTRLEEVSRGAESMLSQNRCERILQNNDKRVQKVWSRIGARSMAAIRATAIAFTATVLFQNRVVKKANQGLE